MSLERVETLRFDDPAASVELAESLLEAEENLIPSLAIMCELGNSLRSCGRLAESSECLLEVVNAAGSRKARRLLSNGLWSLAATRILQGHMNAAITLCSESALEAAFADSRSDIGRAFMVRGVAKHHKGSYLDSQDDFEAAKPYLTRPIDQASLAINKFNNARMLGLAEKIPSLDLQILPVPLQIGLLWVQAREASPADSLNLFSQIFDLNIARQDWVDAALSGTRIVGILAGQGEFDAAAEAVERLKPLLFKLEDNPLARGALGELANAALLKNLALENAARKCILRLSRQTPASTSRQNHSASLCRRPDDLLIEIGSQCSGHQSNQP